MAEPASIRFVKWDPVYEKERPFQIFADLLPDSQDKRKTNLSWEDHDVMVQDIRGREDEFHIDTNGFMTRQFQEFPDLLDRDIVEKEYLPAVEQLLKKELADVGTVHILDWRVRSSEEQTIKDGKIMYSDWIQPLLPANYAHVDISPMGVVQRIQKLFPGVSDRIFRQRIRAVNVWKPLANPVYQWPLAICDGATVESDDLIETDSIRQGFRSSVYYPKYNKEQAWYYLKNQTPDEALIFKHFDSDPEVQMSMTIHSSVRQHNAPESSLPRKSIEVRTFVFSDNFENEL
ncbi:hypothetical protein NPX13_g778 [Xylaria arbuscula]|uniref:Uncharacterized protein n=1 Tax=Xylaria arbuscula TaxID=114810 RepID=A0A9W8TQ76_9PEZI|nr:hypothetical protein NPX13_g778 [Xylaria arbuscula]